MTAQDIKIKLEKNCIENFPGFSNLQSVGSVGLETAFTLHKTDVS